MSGEDGELNKIVILKLLEMVQNTYQAVGRTVGASEKEAFERYTDGLIKRHRVTIGLSGARTWPVDGISIKANLLKGVISSRQCPTAEELDDLDERWRKRRSFGIVRSERLDALEIAGKEPRLMLLGKPGAGKTTFLKFLAVQAIRGKLMPWGFFPILVNLKEWAGSDLVDFLAGKLIVDGFPESGSREFLEHLLEQGKALVLLDDLDEAGVNPQFSGFQSEICQLATRYDKSRFIITRRISARNNSDYFHQFAYAEIAEFDEMQVANFIRHRFREDGRQVERWLAELKKPEHAPIRKLVTNPLLMNLLCQVLEADRRNLPESRAGLLRKGLEILLEKCDEGLKFSPQNPYWKLSLERKILLLSKIAYAFLQKNRYFFMQAEVEKHINEFIAKFKGSLAAVKPADMLDAMEAHHGLLSKRVPDIYSFSHRLVQEYFTAFYIKEKALEVCQIQSPDDRTTDDRTTDDRTPDDRTSPGRALSSIPEISPDTDKERFNSNKKAITGDALNNLADHLVEMHWREVFLLVTELLPPEKAHQLLLLMKERADARIAENNKLQRLLSWAKDKAAAVNTNNRPAAVRGFYLALDRAIAHAFTRAFINTRALDPAPTLDSTLDRALGCSLAPNKDSSPDHYALSVDLALDLALTLEVDFNLADNLVLNLPNLGYSFQHAENLGRSNLAKELRRLLKYKPQNTDSDDKKNAWEKKIKHVMLWYRNLGHNFGLDKNDNSQLKKYLYANKLIANCLNTAVSMGQDERDKILNSLLLPVDV